MQNVMNIVCYAEGDTSECTASHAIKYIINYLNRQGANTYSLWGAGEAELVSHPLVGVVSMSLDQVGHTVLGASAVHDLLAGVVGVHDVGPCYITEVFAFLQLFDRLTNLKQDLLIHNSQSFSLPFISLLLRHIVEVFNINLSDYL